MTQLSDETIKKIDTIKELKSIKVSGKEIAPGITDTDVIIDAITVKQVTNQMRNRK